MCSTTGWVFEHHDSENEERPICRSHPVSAQIKKHENELLAAIESGNFDALDKALTSCAGVDIDVKRRHEAQIMHKKLDHELKIKQFLNQHDHHDNYKHIRKDVQTVNDMLAAATDEGVNVDSHLVQKVNQFTSRLISERNLRKQRDLYIESIASSDKTHVDKLQGLIDNAKQNQVETEYVAHAETLTSQMAGNIKARETLEMLRGYPERDYPEPEDPNLKEKGKKGQVQKKKKKKEPPFPVPDWAEDLNDVIKKVDSMRQLSNDKSNLKLTPEFITRVDDQLTRFKKEISYRKQLEEEARIEAELKALKKKGKKK